MVKKCANAIKTVNYLAYTLTGQTLTKHEPVIHYQTQPISENCKLFNACP
jgi:hypothetical protein